MTESSKPTACATQETCWWKSLLARLRTAVRVVYSLKESPASQRFALTWFGWTTPNQVTVFRGMLTIPVCMLIVAERYWLAIAVGFVAKLLDILDGLLAEAQRSWSELGKHLDPFMDKVFVCGLLATLALTGKLHPFAKAIALAVVVGAVLLTTARGLKKWFMGNTPPASAASSMAGKWKLITEAASLLFILLGLATRSPAVLVFGECLLTLAVALAVRSFYDQMPAGLRFGRQR